MLARAFVAALALVTSACSGVFFIDDQGQACTSSADCGYNRACDPRTGLCVQSNGPCSVTLPDGDCGTGQTCSDGICLCTNASACVCDGVCLSSWCECTPAQGCDDGACVDIVTTGPGANSCTPARPDGVCAGNAACCGGSCCVAGDVCVGDECVPNQRACSPAEPTGWCGPNLGCSNGRCEPLEQCACSPSNDRGCCPDGESCVSGACVVQNCRAGVAGACPQDEVCTIDGCEQLPCSLGHPDGACANGFCSVSGACIPNGTCGGNGDCTLNQYCGADSLCRTTGVCTSNGDCDLQLGQGYLCTGTACVERTTCANDGECVEDKFCSALGNCLEPPKCDASSDCNTASEYCSGNGECVANGCCGVNVDCGSGRLCVERGTCDTCIDEGTCAQDSDCPPTSECDEGASLCQLLPGGETCNSNNFTANCAPNVVSCCFGGGDCCTNRDDICSTTNRCIDFGDCASNADCVTGFTCERFQCVPSGADPCPCGAGERCATVLGQSGCIPDTKCASNAGCPAGQRCNSEYECEPDALCGAEELASFGFVPPNVLIVFDKSGSMNLCGAGDPQRGHCGYNYGACASEAACNSFDPVAASTDGNVECTGPFLVSAPANFGNVCTDDDCNFGCANPSPLAGACSQTSTTSRWSEALNAIMGASGSGGAQGLIDTYAGQVSFGLSIYPNQMGGDGCATNCNWFSCANSSNITAGDIDVAVGLSTQTAIETALLAADPGGSTPTGPTLRSILALPDRGGLDDPDRPNAVLLVTDGEPTGDTTGNIRTCEPPCGDNIKNGDETGVDCGGLCPPCFDTGGESCSSGANCESGQCNGPGVGCEAPTCVTTDDCLSHVCREGQCRLPSCANEVLDSGETAADCGGPCQGCTEGLACNLDSDCGSGICTGGLCAAASCGDGLKNGSETGIDCGGACAAGCANGTLCVVADDCTSTFCDGSTDVCRPVHCNSTTQNGDETGIDCGGSCRPCTTQCSDGVQNGNETDIDCGGNTCADCSGAKTCAAAGDCVSNTCTDCATGQGCRVNAAIDRLYGSDPRIKTYVVGFQLSGSSNLNCHAVHGKTANRNIAGCDELTRTTCDDVGAPTCYYDAANAGALQTAFNDIISQVSSCRLSLTDTPPDFTRMFVYLQDVADPNDRDEVFRGTNWSYDQSTNQIEFFGTACDTLRAGSRSPIVVFGCPFTGG
ncbi:MAG: hypothetical protein ACAI38_16385 [Myxococcota bacterium]